MNTSKGDIFREIAAGIDAYRKLSDEEASEEAAARLRQEFIALTRKTAETKQALSPLVFPFAGKEKDYYSKRLKDGLAGILLLCGCLEGDYNELGFSSPIAYTGGFLLVTRAATVLFDPGAGTIKALTEMNFNFKSIDIIIVSHYHHSASREFQNLLKLCRGERASKKADDCGRIRGKKVWFFSSEAVISGRNDHPALLRTFDKLQIHGSPIVATPGHSWFISREKQSRKIEEIGGTADVRPDGIIISALPACHTEATPLPRRSRDDLSAGDPEGKSGTAVSAYYLQIRNEGKVEFSLLYTGDTAFDESHMPWLGDQAFSLAGQSQQMTPDILIANVKSPGTLDPSSPDLLLKPRTNQLGLHGTFQLAKRLKPQVLVMRSFKLECVSEVTDGRFVYKPENLAIIRETMEKALSGVTPDRPITVIAPGRQIINIKSSRSTRKGESAIEIPSSHAPAHDQYGKRVYGDMYITGNPQLIRTIDGYLAILRATPEPQKQNCPFLTILGNSGVGKTFLAQAMGKDLIAESEKINFFDLATAHENIFESEIFGYKKGAFTGAVSDHTGYLGQPGVLILNNLEKLELSKSQRFLDLLESWQYRITGGHDVPVQPILIFTCNREIEDCDNLSYDLKNRLLGRCLRIPSYLSMEPSLKQRELALIIGQWCVDNNCSLEADAREMLLNKIDYSNGELRNLRNILWKSKELVKISYGRLFTDSAMTAHYFIGAEHIDEARQLNHLRLVQGSASPRSAGIDTTNVIIWRAVIFLSYKAQLNAKKVYRSNKKGATDETAVGSNAVMKNLLKPLHELIENPASFDQHFLGPDRLAILNQEGIAAYASAIARDFSEEIGNPEALLRRIFIKPTAIDKAASHAGFESYSSHVQWLADRSEQLRDLFGNPEMLERTKAKLLSICAITD